MLGSLLPVSLLAIVILLSGCASAPPYVYRYVPGRTAVLRNGYAITPSGAPSAVHAAVAAGNRIAGMPYSYGGGHRHAVSSSYDCSGAASYVLGGAGQLRGSMPSQAFRRYGASGPGDWISVYARRGHVFLVVAGLRFDTGWTGKPKGPAWTSRTRPADGAVIRHPVGL